MTEATQRLRYAIAAILNYPGASSRLRAEVGSILYDRLLAALDDTAPSPPVAPEPAIQCRECHMTVQHKLQCSRRGEPLAPEPAQEAGGLLHDRVHAELPGVRAAASHRHEEAGGVERVSHEVAYQTAMHRVLQAPECKSAIPTLLRYIDQQQAAQEQSEREAAGWRLAARLGTAAVKRLETVTKLIAELESDTRLSDGRHAPCRASEATISRLARLMLDIESPAIPVAGRCCFHSDDVESCGELATIDGMCEPHARVIIATDRDAERTQKEALRVELDVANKANAALRDMLDDQRHIAEVEAASVKELQRLLAKRPTEATPVAKAEAPSEPAGWVPKVGEMVRDKRRTEPPVEVLEVERENGRLLVRCPDGDFWYSLSIVEPVPQPPATTGGADGPGPFVKRIRAHLDLIQDDAADVKDRHAKGALFYIIETLRVLANELEGKQP